MLGFLVAVLLNVSQTNEFFGSDAGVRVVRGTDGSLVDTYYAKDAKGKMRMILAGPTLNGLGSQVKAKSSPLLQTGSDGLFEATPSFGFSEAEVRPNAVVLRAKGDGYTIEKKIEVPASGSLLKVTVACNFTKENPVIRYLLDTYAFAPDGKPMRSYKRPDATYAPAIRPRKDGVIGDHFFRSPVVTVQKGELAASIMPDLDVLKDNRYIPTIVDLDCASGVADAPLMSYGFAGQKLVGHVYFANDTSMTLPAPPELLFSHEILLDAQASPYSGYQKAVKHQWDRYGHRYLDKILPQAVPFAEYANTCYPAAINEKETGGWFDVTIDGQPCGGLPSGWGRGEGWVSWQPWFNQLRSAWGLRWWGKKLKNQDWVEKSTKMLNLALAAPMQKGLCPTTYDSHKKTWKGSLITPDPRCYYDLTNMAWKGIWLLRWLQFDDCPRREDIMRQTSDMAVEMARYQNSDGSFPTWLDKDRKVVPVLDHSAQTALPAWFLAEILQMFRDETRKTTLYTKELTGRGAEYLPGIAVRSELGPAVLKAAEFLSKNIVNQQRYYDFETFFSCSPKQCLQRNGLIDDVVMHDPHTLSPPQNTLCMHWTAEALYRAADLIDQGDPRSKQYRSDSLKALDIMALYQNVWPISYRKTAYTYGGFGVQNSDGEYNDARQAQFADTLADFGAELGRQDYFERGVAATRASMALINHPMHEYLGIYPNPNYPLGLQPENVAHGGSDHQAGRTGPDWGEMSGLTSMAWLLDKYGGAYENKAGWKVGVDGVVVHPKTSELATFNFMAYGQNQIWDFRTELATPSGRETKRVRARPCDYEGSFVGVATYPDGHDEYAVVMELIGCLKLTGYDGQFINAGGQRMKADVGTFGASDGGGCARAVITPDFAKSPIRFEGEVEGWKIVTDPVQYFIDPVFDMKNWRMPGWTFDGDFLHWPVKNPRSFNWNNSGLPFIGTCEDGRGAFDDEFLGTIESPWFLITKPTIRLKVGGGSGEGVYVELLNSTAAPPGKDGTRILVARGRNSETMDEVVWDVSKFKGQYLKIRIVDKEKGGWGHINVGNIRCTNG